jgi:16S rRNA processing protein RimM
MKSPLVLLGKVIREWGVRGQVKFASYNPRSDLYLHLKKIYLEKPDGLHLLEIEKVARHGAFWLFKFAGYADPETSRELRGLQLGLPREELPPLQEGEYYLSDLIGREVIGPEGEVIGTIHRWNTVGEIEVMTVKRPGGGEAMVPFHGQFVELEALKAGQIVLKKAAEELL